MKKKLLAAIAAGMLLCGMLTAPVSAAETYQKGDVNMDGVIDVADAQLALQFFCDWLCIKGGNLTEEQQALGNVDGEMSVMQWKSEERVTPVSVRDAQIILIYYTKHLTDATVTMDVLLESLGIK